jgi:SAM-dependent methyltransferase
MSRRRFIPVFDWFANQFTIEEAAERLEQMGPNLTSLFQSGDSVLDLGCGAGAISFYLEEQGAQVRGIDLAPGLVSLAQEEAGRRGSSITFTQGDVLSCPLGREEYDLVVCLGNVILEFPHQDFARFRERVFQALKPLGRFALEYRDGLLRMKRMSEPREVIEEGAEGQVRRRFKGYDPVRGAFLSEYCNLVTGQIYEGTSYIYTGPMIRMVLEERFAFERSVRLSEISFLDVYVKQP